MIYLYKLEMIRGILNFALNCDNSDESMSKVGLFGLTKAVKS